MINSTFATEHAEFLSLLPGLELWARTRFRFRNAADRDDAVADAIAYGYASFLRLKQRGKDPSAFLVAFSKFVVMAVANGRAIGRKFSSRDIMCAHSLRSHCVAVHGFDDPLPDGEGWWRDMIADLRTNVADQAAFNVDFPAWIGTLSTVKQQVTKLLAHGHGTDVTAELAAMSAGRVSQLRRELAKSWDSFNAGN
jgi:hypothetical protein